MIRVDTLRKVVIIDAGGKLGNPLASISQPVELGVDWDRRQAKAIGPRICRPEGEPGISEGANQG